MGLAKTVAFSNLFWRFLRNRKKKIIRRSFPTKRTAALTSDLKALPIKATFKSLVVIMSTNLRMLAEDVTHSYH